MLVPAECWFVLPINRRNSWTQIDKKSRLFKDYALSTLIVF
jgi:hypothetical protein